MFEQQPCGLRGLRRYSPRFTCQTSLAPRCCQRLADAVSRAAPGLRPEPLLASWPGNAPSPCRSRVGTRHLVCQPAPKSDPSPLGRGSLFGLGRRNRLAFQLSPNCRRPFSESKLSAGSRVREALLPPLLMARLRVSTGALSSSRLLSKPPDLLRLRLERFRTSHARVDSNLTHPQGDTREFSPVSVDKLWITGTSCGFFRKTGLKLAVFRRCTNFSAHFRLAKACFARWIGALFVQARSYTHAPAILQHPARCASERRVFCCHDS